MLLLLPQVPHINRNVFHTAAGSEPTALTLAFTTWALAQKQDIQTKPAQQGLTYDDFGDPNHFSYLALSYPPRRVYRGRPRVLSSARSEKFAEESRLRYPIRGLGCIEMNSYSGLLIERPWWEGHWHDDMNWASQEIGRLVGADWQIYD